MLAFDLRDAIRGLGRDRLYSLLTILTLALTVGATTAVFSIVNGVLLKPLAYSEPDRLVWVRELWQLYERWDDLEANERHFEYWRSHAQSFDSLAEFIDLPRNLTGAGEAAQINVVHTSSSLFDVLRVQPALGRALQPDDERADRPDVIVLSDALWRERFGANPALVGQSVSLDGKPYIVVGVTPPGLRLPQAGDLTAQFDAFVPIKVEVDQVGWVGDHNNSAIGRLRDGVTLQQALAEMNVLQSQVGAIASREGHETVALGATLTPLTETVVGGARRGLIILLAAILAVLLIACANLANLSLTRGLARSREAAIRAALGATRARLVSRGLLEQLVLAATGGVLGVAVARLALLIFVTTAPVDLPRVNEVALDLRVLAFAAAVSMLAGLVVALLPAWRIASSGPQAALRTGGGTFTGDPHAMRARAILLAAQVGLSLVLLVVTGLLTTSFLRLMKVDKGFTSDHVLAVNLAMPANRYGEEPVRRAAYDRLIADVRALPGVASASTTSMLPMRGQGQVNFIVEEGSTRPPTEYPTANFRFVGPEFFRTLGIRLVRGRAFTDSERRDNRPAPVVISEATAAVLWPGQDPIGKRFSRGISREQAFEVVGVAADARTTTVARRPPAMVYLPYWWRSRPSVSLLIKTASDPIALLPSVRRAVHAIDPDIAIGQSRTLDDIVETSFAGRRYQMRLFVTFGIAALLIAMLGVYAVTSYGVSRRRREMNIRVALGATGRQVLALVLRQGAVPLAIGIVAGVAGALAAGTVVASQLYEVSARDPRTIAVVVALVGLTGAGATLVAAKQGLALDPAAALRDE